MSRQGTMNITEQLTSKMPISSFVHYKVNKAVFSLIATLQLLKNAMRNLPREGHLFPHVLQRTQHFKTPRHMMMQHWL